MDETWWPAALGHIPKEDRLAGDDVVLAELKNVDGDGHRDGERRSFCALIPMAELDAVSKNFRGLGHEVRTSGPHPVPEAAGDYSPKFWIDAKDLPSERYEPLVLAWTSHNTTTLVMSPGLLMTYGLTPRHAHGVTIYDDPTEPAHGVVTVSGPSVWDMGSLSPARVTIRRDYLEDYLTLRGMALVEVFYEIAFAPLDEDAGKALNGKQAQDFKFADRLIALSTQRDGRLVAQVWGARLIAKPGGLPISDDPLEKNGLSWPGIDGAITNDRASGFGVLDFVYVDDAVLGAYEGRQGFSVSPHYGGVSFGVQWSVGFVDRVGRNTLQLEVKKLYEGAPPSVIQYWHRFAVAPPADLMRAEKERNVATRAQELVEAILCLGDQCAGLARATSLSLAATDFIRLDRADLAYRGWWTPSAVEPITRHIPLTLSRDGFLERAKFLNSLAVEGLSEGALRRLARAVGAPAKDIEDLRGLKLLDLLVRMASVAHTAGLKLTEAGPEVWRRLQTDGADPARPITYLFALNDMRQLAAHDMSIEAKLPAILERLSIDEVANAGGYGASLDRVYDLVIEHVRAAADALEQVVEVG